MGTTDDEILVDMLEARFLRLWLFLRLVKLVDREKDGYLDKCLQKRGKVEFKVEAEVEGDIDGQKIFDGGAIVLLIAMQEPRASLQANQKGMCSTSSLIEVSIPFWQFNSIYE
jgi:hypothetical protein